MHPDAGFSKLPDANIVEPDIGPVIRKSDMSLAFEILQSSAELVLRAFAIWILMRLGPFVQVLVDVQYQTACLLFTLVRDRHISC